ncbi:GT-D fold domain-containing glycosyltransferase [Alteribacillus sp. YIM 98480]|uniref:GT-D fold domain-containing glycosyltransferase n=1 Tax=Alteribacillus sp. YIM 98480 TaxID=2606599 RepID=UPI00131BBF5A|nr:GT-D fold domain-containing glycosyltransferase [Alteribacillus sp. YIM 98480]
MNETKRILQLIKKASQKNSPFSLVRIGDGENLVLAHGSVWPVKRVLREPWGRSARKGRKGIDLPNFELRNRMVTSIKKADVVGILPKHGDMINAPKHVKRELTDKVFRHYNIQPKLTCSATINRELMRNHDFWEILRRKKILIIYGNAENLKTTLQNNYGLKVNLAIPFSHYNQINRTLKLVLRNKNKFDIALVSCGVNSVILSQRISELTGKIAIDFGKASKFILTEDHNQKATNPTKRF